MKQFLYQAEWLGLDKKLREKLKEIFVINRSEGMKVTNGQLASDGCSQSDLTAGITIGKMIEYLDKENTTYKVNTENSEKIFDELFERVVKTATAEIFLKDVGNIIKTKELNSNIKEDEKTNKGTERESEGAKIESKGDKQTTGDGNDRPSGDGSINAGSGDRQDIQRPKTENKSKRAGHSSGKGTDKGKKAS